jgi:hypothetical protein
MVTRSDSEQGVGVARPLCRTMPMILYRSLGGLDQQHKQRSRNLRNVGIECNSTLRLPKMSSVLVRRRGGIR